MTFLRGVFLTSEQPAVTAEFYREVVGLALEEMESEPGYIYWRLDKDNVQIAIHDAEKFAEYSHPARQESNLTHLYFKIDSQEEFLDHLEQLGITPYLRDDVVVTLEDPDGRKVMFGTA